MRLHRIAFVQLVCLFAAASFTNNVCNCWASPLGHEIVIEPDDFTDGQILDNVSAHVNLSSTGNSDQPTFSVWARTDIDGASTGAKVFSHSGVPFWNKNRKLRMDFLSPVTSISLDFVASGFFGDSYQGRLEAFATNGTLVASNQTPLLAEGLAATMTVTAPNIDYALAYPPLEPFGDLDHVRFTVVPEPAAMTLAAFATAICAAIYRRRNRQFGRLIAGV